MTWWTSRSCPSRRRSAERAVVSHRNCSHQWALWRRSGEDRRIKRTETWEGVLCERWDSRRGSIRRPSLYRAQGGRVNARETVQGCKDWIIWSNIYAVCPSQRERWRHSGRIALLQDRRRRLVYLSFMQNAQKDGPARPQRVKGRRRTLWGARCDE